MEILLLFVVLPLLLATVIVFIKSDPFTRAQKLEFKGQIDDALAIYKKIAAEQPENTAALFKVASILFDRKQHTDAIPVLQRIIESSSAPEQKTEARQKLGASLFFARQFKAALKTLTDLEADNSIDPQGWMYMGIIALKMGVSHEASRYLERAADRIKDNFDLAFSRGVALTMEENYKEALKAFHQAEMIHPEDPRIRLLAGLTAYLDQQPMRAADLLEPITRDATAEPAFRFAARRGLAFTMMMRQKSGDAESLWRELEEYVQTPGMEDYRKEILYDTGFFYLSQNESGRALECWETLQKEFPDFPGIEELISLLKEKSSAADEESTDEAALPEASTGYTDPRSREVIDWRTVPDDPEKTTSQKIKEQTRMLLDEWKIRAISPETVLGYSGLLEQNRFDVYSVLGDARAGRLQPASQITTLLETENKQFDATMKKLITRLGFKSYKPLQRKDTQTAVSDGVDAVAAKPGGTDTLIQTRRWKQGKIEDMPLKDMLGRMEDLKCRQGILITTAVPGPAARNFLEKHTNIRVIGGEELEKLLERVD